MNPYELARETTLPQKQSLKAERQASYHGTREAEDADLKHTRF